jgi:hypothetical protein
MPLEEKSKSGLAAKSYTFYRPVQFAERISESKSSKRIR